MIESTLGELGLNENQAKLWLAVRQYGPSPASSLGSVCGFERTHAHKILQQLIDMMLVASTLRGKTAYYYVPDKSVLKSFHQRKLTERQQQEDHLTIIETQLDQLVETKHPLTPPIRLWTGESGVAQGLDDIITLCTTHELRQICILGSKTFESIATSEQSLGAKRSSFFSKLDHHHIHIEGYGATGILVLEKIVAQFGSSELQELPTGKHSIQVIIVGDHLYYLLYRREPIMLKISSEEIAGLMRVLLNESNFSK